MKIENSLKNIVASSPINAGGNVDIGDTININVSVNKLVLSTFTPDKIIDEFKKASRDLKIHRNYFQNLLCSHIEREETKELYDWIFDDESKQNIGMLTGAAGSGKSVILKDLFHKLSGKNIAVLGIKSDKNYAGSLKKLRDRTGLTEDIQKMVQKLSFEGKKIVILIDQIDALSLSHSAEDKYLRTIQRLVQDLEGIDGVKIVLSVRKWDLKHNAGLNITRSDEKGRTFSVQREFSVKPLSLLQVKSVLKQLNIKLSTFPDNLLELLRIPLHLDIFTSIYSSKLGLKSLRNLHDLYYILWKKKILNLPSKKKITSKKCTKLLNTIAKEINVSTSEIKYETEFSKEIEYLKSAGLLIGDGKTIQFFHQTFHDFVFAKQFVESGESAYDFLLENHQNLKIRIKLKMIINYLREYDEKDYLSIMQKLLKSKKIYFHVKLLLINLLGYRDEIFSGERTIVSNYILTNKNLLTPFLEAAEGDDWLPFLIEKKVLDEMFFLKQKKSETKDEFSKRQAENRRFASHLLGRKVQCKMNLVLKYVRDLKSYTGKSANMMRILSSVKNWDSPLAKEVYTNNKADINDYDFPYWSRTILGDAAVFDFDWAIKLYKPYLDKLTNISKPTEKFEFVYDDIEFAKTLFKINKEKAFLLYFEVVEKLCSKSTYGDYEVKPDFVFSGYSFVKDSNRDNLNYALLDLMIENLQEMAQDKSPINIPFLKQNENSPYAIILYVIANGIIANPEEYSNAIFDFIILLNKREALSEKTSFTFSLRLLINKAYPHFTENQQKRLNEIILNVQSKYESFTHPDRDNKPKIMSNVGMLKLLYLKSIPEKERKKFRNINRTYQELNRKFGSLNDKSSESFFRMGPVPAPFQPNDYDYFNIDKWQESFEKYNSEYVRDMFNNKGSRESHAKHFKDQITKRPNDFIDYINLLITDEKIYFPYKLAAIEGLFAADYQIETCISLFETLTTLPAAEKYADYIIRITEHFIKEQNISKSIVNYLISHALSNSNPTAETIAKSRKNKIDYQLSISTNRGLAARRLAQITFTTEFKSEIFTTLNTIIETDYPEVIVEILLNLKWHLKANREQTLHLFLKIVALKEGILLFNGLDCSRFLSQSHFPEIRSYFAHAAEIKECQKSVSIILAWARYRGEKECDELHEKLCKTSADARAILVEVAAHGLQDDAESSLMQHFFMQGYTDTSAKVKLAYAGAFRTFKVEDFSKIYPLLKTYSISPASEMNLYAYYDYLRKCSDQHPKKCLKLMKKFKNNTKEDVEGNGHFRTDEPIGVILGAINSLEANAKENRESINLGMKLFNRFSQYPNLRSYAQKALLESEK